MVDQVAKARDIGCPDVEAHCPNCNRAVMLRPSVARGEGGRGPTPVGKRTGLVLRPTPKQERTIQGLACPLCYQRQDNLARVSAEGEG
jgi:Zn ribbon nucleic-acid-binding protein